MAVKKKVTVFIDYFSKQNLEEQNIDVRKIFRLAEEKFSEQGVPLGYDLNDLRIEYLPIKHKKRLFEWLLTFISIDIYWYFKVKKIFSIIEEIQDLPLRTANQTQTS